MIRRILVFAFSIIGIAVGTPAIHAQKISRTVLAPSTSVMTVSGGMQWSAGQAATQQYIAGPQRLTTGFQQSYRNKRTLALLRATNFEGNPGDTVLGQLRLEGLSVVGTRPSALRVTISFNKTLLTPISINNGSSAIIRDVNDATLRSITFEAPVDQTSVDADFADIKYIAGLGNDSLTVISIDEVVPLGTPSTISTRDGVFTLLGICREGGPRLIDPESPIVSIRTAPNPAVEFIDLGFELSEDISLSVGLYNMIGEQVRSVLEDETVLTGQHKIRIDLSTISSGTYVLALSVNGKPLSTLVTVGR